MLNFSMYVFVCVLRFQSFARAGGAAARQARAQSMIVRARGHAVSRNALVVNAMLDLESASHATKWPPRPAAQKQKELVIV